MRLKIISDGHPQGTRVVDADTGADTGLLIKDIQWSIGIDQIGQAVITVLDVPLEVTADQVETVRLPPPEVQPGVADVTHIGSKETKEFAAT